MAFHRLQFKASLSTCAPLTTAERLTAAPEITELTEKENRMDRMQNAIMCIL